MNGKCPRIKENEKTCGMGHGAYDNFARIGECLLLNQNKTRELLTKDGKRKYLFDLVPIPKTYETCIFYQASKPSLYQARGVNK